MEKLQQENKVKYLGVSNFYSPEYLKHLYEDALVKPKFVQNRFYGETDFDNEIRKFCKKNDMIYQSFWTLTANPWIYEAPLIVNLAKKYQKTPVQIYFRFLTQKEIIILIGSTSIDHIQQDLDIFNFILNTEEMKLLNHYIDIEE